MGYDELEALPDVPEGAGGDIKPDVAMHAQLVRFGGICSSAGLSPGMYVIPRGIL